MRIVAYNVTGQKVIDTKPYKCTIEKSTRGYDEIHCTMYIKEPPSELVKLNAYVDDALIFTGESVLQRYFLGEHGWTLDIDGISTRSIMMRNNAVPGSMGLISFQNLLYTIAGPYDVTSFIGVDRPPTVSYYIGTGMSDWEVIERYSLINFGVLPRLLPNNVIDITDMSPSSSLLFCNNSTNVNAIKYCDLSTYFKRDGIISQYVTLAPPANTYYSVNVFDEVATQRKIKHRKINQLNGYTLAEKNSILYGKERSARYQSRGYKLTVNGIKNIDISKYAVLQDDLLGNIYNLIATECKFIYNNGALRTEIDLQPDENVL